MSARNNKDALLVTAKVGTVIARIGLVIGMIALGLAGTLAVLEPAMVGAEIMPDAGPDAMTGRVIAAFVALIGILIVSLGLMYAFVGRLAAIIDTVGEGDPFTLDNAARMTRMAWEALAVQLLGIPAMAIGGWLSMRVEEEVLEGTWDLSFTALAVAVILFILARVFRKGTEMREELEGTV